jgi:hypothetical protein
VKVANARHLSRFRRLRWAKRSPRIIGRSAVMRVAMRGERIARGSSRLNVWNRAGARTLRGLPYPLACRQMLLTDRVSWRPIDTLGRRRKRRFIAGFAKARERSLGEGPDKVSGGTPWKGRNPREHPAVGELTPRPSARDSRKGQNPGAEACWAGPPLRRREYR